MATLDQQQLAQIVSAVLSALNTSTASPKGVAAAQPGDRLAQKDRALIAGLKRKGIPADQIVLMDRNDPKRPYNVKPFKAWLQDGRMVTKGQHGIRGLFHISQTSPIAKPSAKPAPKGKAKAKPAPQPAA